jgi:hypothetical protein
MLVEKAYLYVVLTRTNTIISRLIYLFTRDEYTHAALSLDKELTEMYSFARKYTYNPFVGRFKHEYLGKGVYKHSKYLPGVVLEIEVPKESYDEARKLVEQFIANRSRYKYNFRGLIYGLLNKPTTREDRFLCSQFVYFVLNQSGVVDFHMPANLVRPVDFLGLDAQIVFQGNLKELVANAETDYPVRIRLYRWVRERISSMKAG